MPVEVRRSKPRSRTETRKNTTPDGVENIFVTTKQVRYTRFHVQKRTFEISQREKRVAGQFTRKQPPPSTSRVSRRGLHLSGGASKTSRKGRKR